MLNHEGKSEICLTLLQKVLLHVLHMQLWGMTNLEVEGLICDLWVGWRIGLGNGPKIAMNWGQI